MEYEKLHEDVKHVQSVFEILKDYSGEINYDDYMIKVIEAAEERNLDPLGYLKDCYEPFRKQITQDPLYFVVDPFVAFHELIGSALDELPDSQAVRDLPLESWKSLVCSYGLWSKVLHELFEVKDEPAKVIDMEEFRRKKGGRK